MKQTICMLLFVCNIYAMDQSSNKQHEEILFGPASSTSWRDESHMAQSQNNSQDDLENSQEQIIRITEEEPIDWSISKITVTSSGHSFFSEDAYQAHSFFSIQTKENSEEFSISQNERSLPARQYAHSKGAEWIQIASDKEFMVYLKLKKLHMSKNQKSPLWQFCINYGYNPENNLVPFMEKKYFIEHFLKRHNLKIDALKLVYSRCEEKFENLPVDFKEYLEIQQRLMDILEEQALACNLAESCTESHYVSWIDRIVKNIDEDPLLKEVEKYINNTMYDALSGYVINDDIIKKRAEKTIKKLYVTNVASIAMIILGIVLYSIGCS